GAKPLSGRTYRGALRRWLERCEIRDEYGRPVHLTPHQWRHTLGTRLINRDVPQHVVQKILDHDSPQMTALYARLSDTTVRRHWENARKVNIAGDTVTLDPAGQVADAAWAKQRLGRATQALPNGYCGLPIQQSCPHANSCFSELTVLALFVRFLIWICKPGGMGDGADDEARVAAVDAGQGVAEADRGSAGEAGGQEEHAPFPAAGRQFAGVQGGDGCFP